MFFMANVDQVQSEPLAYLPPNFTRLTKAGLNDVKHVIGI